MIDLLDLICIIFDGSSYLLAIFLKSIAFVIDLILYPFIKSINLSRKKKKPYESFYITKKIKIPKFNSKRNKKRTN